MTWLYDNLGWWADAVHRSACPVVSLWHDAKRGLPLLSSPAGLNEAYSDGLRYLAEQDMEPGNAALFLFLRKAFRKWKITDGTTSETRKSAALDSFIQRNFAAQSQPALPCNLRYEMKRLLSYWLPEPPTLPIGKFGPGAVAEHYNHCRRYIALQRWCSAGSQWPEVPCPDILADHQVARLCAVPKQYDKDRLITVEPVYASFCQAYARQAIQASIHMGPLSGTCMDLGFTDGQLIQRRLALKASRTGGNATLDLKDASDHITWRDVTDVFPLWVVHLLDVSRSQAVEDPRDHKVYPLSIFAGMGNGATFTVETLFFAALVIAAHQTYGCGRPWVSVFGDDVICDSRLAHLLRRLHLEAFEINEGKSFIADDRLRESCGIFAYRGYDITVPKVDGYPRTHEGILGIVDLHRRLYASRWSFLQRLAYTVASQGNLVNWPDCFDGYPSIYDPRVPWSAAPETRWNTGLQRKEARLPIIRQRVRHFPTADWAARRYNLPPAAVWYTAVLAGLVRSADNQIHSLRDCGRQSHSVSIPVEGETELVYRWVAARPPTGE